MRGIDRMRERRHEKILKAVIARKTQKKPLKKL